MFQDNKNLKPTENCASDKYIMTILARVPYLSINRIQWPQVSIKT